MQNFIFISPNFPTNYWQFCRELKNDGMNVLGIGDQPYDELKPELKDSLNEYYKVGSLENYDEVYRAVAFFAFKYGRIDWLSGWGLSMGIVLLMRGGGFGLFINLLVGIVGGVLVLWLFGGSEHCGDGRGRKLLSCGERKIVFMCHAYRKS